jgi:phage host-nuclease inhibitor protein Gam
VERLSREVKELEDEADDLKEDMEGQYVGGFRSVIEQVQVLFPDIDGDVLAQADFLKKIQDGKLVSRLPA